MPRPALARFFEATSGRPCRIRSLLSANGRLYDPTRAPPGGSGRVLGGSRRREIGENRTARGDLLLLARLTDLRKGQARRERVGAGVQGKGARTESRRHDPGKQESCQGPRVRKPRSRHPFLGREGPLEAARSRGQDGERAS